MRQLLRSILVGESRAYGFTIAFWGSGILLVKAHQALPGIVEVMGYGTGAVLGFGLLSVVAFSRPLGSTGPQEQEYLVLSMVHYLAALSPIAATHLIIELGLPYRFVLSGASVSVLYNAGMLVEEWISEEARTVERALER